MSKSSFEPGTRNMSPKEQKITSGCCAMASALSIISSEVTQTGQPGPWTSSISSGNKRSIPYFTIACVLPAADFHQDPRFGGEAPNFSDDAFRQRFVPVFVEIFHAARKIARA